MKKLLLTASLAVATLFATAASAQVIYTASFATNPDQWGAQAWQDANDTISFASGYMSFSSAGSDRYINSNVPVNISAMFAPGNMPSITFDARASAPNGTDGLLLELQNGWPVQYVATSGVLTDTWQTFTMNSFSFIHPLVNPANIGTLGFSTGNLNMGTIDIRNLTIAAAPIPEPSSFAALAGLAALAGVGLRRRRRA